MGNLNTVYFFNWQKPGLLLKGLVVFCLMVCSYPIAAQNTPLGTPATQNPDGTTNVAGTPAACAAGFSIYSIDHEDATIGFLPGGFCVTTDLANSGTTAITVTGTPNGAGIGDVDNIVVDGGRINYSSTDGGDLDATYEFCSTVTNPYVFIGDLETFTTINFFDCSGNPVNVNLMNGQSRFAVSGNSALITGTTSTNQDGYVQVPGTYDCLVININNPAPFTLDVIQIAVGVCMPDPPMGTMTCPYDLYMWKKDAYCAPVYRDANGVFYEKDQNNNNIASLGNELWTNAPICGELVLLEADCAIQDNSCTPDFTCDAVPVAVEYYEPMGSGCLFSTYWYDITNFSLNDPDPGNQWSAIFSGTDAFGLPAHPSAPTQAAENCGLDWLGDNEGTIDFDDEAGGANEDEQLQMDGWLYVASHLECIQFRVGSSATDHSVGLYVGTDLNNMTFVAEENDDQAGSGNNSSGVVGSYCIPNTVSTTNDACGWKILRVRIYAHDDDTAYDPAIDWSFNGGLTWDVVEEQWFVSATSANDNTPPTGVAGGGGGGCNPIPTNLIDTDNVLADLEGKLWQIPGNCNSAPTNLYEPNIPNGNNAEEGDHLSLIPYCVLYNDDVNIDCEPCAIDIVVEGCACSNPDNMFSADCIQSVSAYQQTLVVNSDINTSYTITSSSGISGLAGPFMTAGTSETYTFFVTPGAAYSVTVMGDQSMTSQTYEGLCSAPDACNCPPQPEICGDGLDNDCDGAVDEADSDIVGNCSLDCGPAVTPVEIQGREMQLDGKLTHQVWSRECGNTGCCPSSLNPHSCALTAFTCTDVNGLPQHNNACGPADPCAPAGPQGAAGCTGNDVFTLLGSTHGQAPQFYSTAAEQTQLDGWLVLPPSITCFELKVNHPRAWDAQAVYMGAGIASMNFVGATSFPPQENYTNAVDCQSDMNANPNVTGENFQYDISSGATPITVAGCTWNVVRVRAYIFDESWYHVTPVQWNIGNGFETIPSRYFQSVGPTGWDTDNNKPTAANIVETAPFCAYQDGDGDLFLQNGDFYALNTRKCEQIVTNDCLSCPDNLTACLTSGECVTPLVDAAGNPISDVPTCNLELFTITPQVLNPVAGNGLLTRYWDHNDGNCIDNEITNQSIFCAFNAYNANPATCPGCLPQHPNNSNPTGTLNLTTLGVRGSDLPQDADNDNFVITAINRRSGENAQQDGWLLVPPGFDCLEFRISSPQWDAGALYLGTDIDNMTMVGENVNARGENPVDSFYYDIPANAPTLACPDCIEPLRYIRVRTYHHDNNMAANTVWEWNLGNGFVNVPMENLFPVSDQCSNTLPSTCPTFSDGASYIAVLEDLNNNQVADIGERWFRAPASWTSCDAAQSAFDINMIPSMDLASVGPCDEQVYIPCSICCSFDVTCPNNLDLGTYDCNTFANIPVPPTVMTSPGGDITVDNAAGDYNIDIGDEPCGDIVTFTTDSETPDVCVAGGQNITRTVSVFDDLNGNGMHDPATEEPIQTCDFTLVIIANAPPVVTCPSDLVIEGCEVGDIGGANPPYTEVGGTITEAEYLALGGTIVEDCAVASIEYVDSQAGSCPIVVNRVYTITDDCGNIDACNQTILIDDTVAPIITCPPTANIEGCDTDAIAAAGLPAFSTTSAASTEAAFIAEGGTVTEGCNVAAVAYVDVAVGTCPIVVTRTYTLTDDCGNSSSCDQLIVIDDTTAPALTGAQNMTVECDGAGNAADLAAWLASNGGATATDDCGFVWTNNFVALSDDCGATGSATVTFTATDPCGNVSSTTATFTISDTQAPVITCPPSQFGLTCNQNPPAAATTFDEFIAQGGTITEGCTPLNELVVVDMLSDNGGTNCPGDGLIITRTYTVIDDCGNASSCDQTFTYIASTTGPVITSVAPTCYKYCAELANPMESDITFDTDCNFGGTVSITGPTQIGPSNCQNTIYRYTYTVTDDCGRVSAPVSRDFVIGNEGPTIECQPFNLILECGDPNNDDYIATHLSQVNANASCDLGVTISNNFTGLNFTSCTNSTKVVTFTATDDCGRTATCTTTITLQDNTAPDLTSTYVDGICNEAICGSNVNFWFNEWMDKVEEGLSATDQCDNFVTFTTIPSNPQPNQDCPDNETETVVTWVANDNCGNTTTIQYSFYVVPAAGATVSGMINTEMDEAVEAVEVTLSGGASFFEMMTTANDGMYSFTDVPLEQNYQVTPYLNQNPLNGVSSFDLILIAQHILGISDLDSPYKMIAADVNSSGSITTLDILELRKLILFIETDFPNNTSWRFVEGAFVFPNPTNPFASTFPEVVDINGLLEDVAHDFIGVKIGDVNNSAIPNNLTGGEDRSFNGDLHFNVNDKILKAGDTYEVAFTSDNFEAVAGYQYTLNFDASQLEFVSVEAGDLEGISESNFGLSLLESGAITTSWTNREPVSLNEDVVLFNVTFTAKSDVQLSEALSASSRFTAAEAYEVNTENGQLNLLNVGLRFDELAGENRPFALLQNMPNPFVEETSIGFILPEASAATLTIYDVSGRILHEIDGTYESGYNEIRIDRSELTVGVLYYQLVTTNHTATKKMMLTYR